MCPGMKAPLGVKFPLALRVLTLFTEAHSQWLGLGTGHHTTSCPMSRAHSVTYMPWQMGSVLWSSSNQTVVKSPHNCIGENSEDNTYIRQGNSDEFVVSTVSSKRRDW